jgi:hypothetical protein
MPSDSANLKPGKRAYPCWYVGDIYKRLSHVGGDARKMDGHDDRRSPEYALWVFTPHDGSEPVLALGRDLKHLRSGKRLA